jgi:CheY-like chemotaxis protein
MNLPDIDGQHVLAELKADSRTKDIPVVIVSADAVSTRIERLLEDGAKAYLTKPISVTNFLSIVDDALKAA